MGSCIKLQLTEVSSLHCLRTLGILNSLQEFFKAKCNFVLGKCKDTQMLFTQSQTGDMCCILINSTVSPTAVDPESMARSLLLNH